HGCQHGILHWRSFQGAHGLEAFPTSVLQPGSRDGEADRFQRAHLHRGPWYLWRHQRCRGVVLRNLHPACPDMVGCANALRPPRLC
ncbi:bgs1, partial [Symbiodinium sp. CCMP2456]